MPRVRGRYNVIAAMTFQEIAEIEGTSPQRIWELEQRYLKKIRKYLLKRFGDSVTIQDILPNVREGTDYAMFEL